jgi:hypothetical protein
MYIYIYKESESTYTHTHTHKHTHTHNLEAGEIGKNSCLFPFDMGLYLSSPSCLPTPLCREVWAGKKEKTNKAFITP